MRPASLFFVPVLLLAAPSAASPSSALAASPSPCFAEKISLRGPNAGGVTPFLYRGAQPSLAELSLLKKLAVTSIVDLRAEATHTSNLERSRAESLGIRFVHIPVGGLSPLLRRNSPISFLSSAPYRRKPYSCTTNLAAIAPACLSLLSALPLLLGRPTKPSSEMLAFGFHRAWHPGMASFVRDLPHRLQCDPPSQILTASPNHPAT